MNSFTILLALVAVAAADKIPDFIIPGQCPKVDLDALWTQQQPNHARYAGKWYMQALTNNPYMPIAKCHNAEYTFDGNLFEAKSTGIAHDGNLLRHNGQLYPNPLGVPVLSIDYDNMFASPYTILDTDYDSYSCVYSCVEYNFGYYSDFAFIFSRSPSISDANLRKCQKAFQDINVDTSRFAKLEQGSSCPYDAQSSL